MNLTLALWLGIISLPCLLIGVFLTKSHVKDVEFEHIEHPEKSHLENAANTSKIKMPFAFIFMIIGLFSFLYASVAFKII